MLISELPPKLRALAKEYQRRWGFNKGSNSINSFGWDMPPEGTTFWAELNRLSIGQPIPEIYKPYWESIENYEIY